MEELVRLRVQKNRGLQWVSGAPYLIPDQNYKAIYHVPVLLRDMDLQATY